MLRSRCAPAVAVLAGALLLSGCAQGIPKSPDKTAEYWLRAVGSADPESACHLSASNGRPFEPDTPEFRECMTVIDYLSAESDLSAYAQATVTGASLGEPGRATVSAEHIEGVLDTEDLGTMELMEIEGRWYFDADQWW